MKRRDFLKNIALFLAAASVGNPDFHVYDDGVPCIRFDSIPMKTSGVVTISGTTNYDGFYIKDSKPYYFSLTPTA